MVETLLYLAEAHSEVEGGFGLNLNILETNLINLSILLGILYFYGSKIVGDILSERRSKIAQQIEEIEQKQKTAAATLANEQEKLAVRSQRKRCVHPGNCHQDEKEYYNNQLREL